MCATLRRYLGESETQSTRMEYAPQSFSEITTSCAAVSLLKTRYHDAHWVTHAQAFKGTTEVYSNLLLHIYCCSLSVGCHCVVVVRHIFQERTSRQ